MGVTLREIAEQAKVTYQAVHRAERQGRIAEARLPDGTYDLERAVVTFHKNRKRAPGPGRNRKRPPPTGSGSSLLDLQARHERIRIEERAIKVRRQRGELVAWAPFRRQIFDMVRAERDAWLAWPARVATTLSAEFALDLGLLQISLEREVRSFLRELASRMPIEVATPRKARRAPAAELEDDDEAGHGR